MWISSMYSIEYNTLIRGISSATCPAISTVATPSNSKIRRAVRFRQTLVLIHINFDFLPRSSWHRHLYRIYSSQVISQSRVKQRLQNWVSQFHRLHAPEHFDNLSMVPIQSQKLTSGTMVDTSQWPLLLKNYDKLLIRSSHFTPIPTVSLSSF